MTTDERPAGVDLVREAHRSTTTSDISISAFPDADEAALTRADQRMALSAESDGDGLLGYPWTEYAADADAPAGWDPITDRDGANLPDSRRPGLPKLPLTRHLTLEVHHHVQEGNRPGPVPLTPRGR